MNLCVAILAYNRPEYLKQTLEHLDAALAHAGQPWCVRPLFDGGHSQEVFDMLGDFSRRWPCAPTGYIFDQRLGTRRAAYCLLAEVFGSKADGALYLEDDVLLSPDALRLCEAYMADGTLRHDRSAGLALNSQVSDPSRPNHLYIDTENQGLMGCGFFCTAVQWHSVYARYWWDRTEWPDEWDYSVGHSIHANNLDLWRPRLNRARNVGLYGCNSAGTLPPGYNEVAATAIENDYVWEIGSTTV